MIIKSGISKTQNSTIPSTSTIKDSLSQTESKLYVVRVTDIVLDSEHPRFNEVGQYNGIGAIFFESPDLVSFGKDLGFALPYDSHLKVFPLVDEIVTITLVLNQSRNTNTIAKGYFYQKPINIWNTPNHNSFPELEKPLNLQNLKPNPTLNTQQTAQLNSLTNPSKDPFIEKSNIRSIQPQPGDTIIEGRNGQSIRFNQEKGDPIIFIRNGQNRTTPSSGFEPISEDVKNDLSSIYLTSYQSIPNLSLETEKGIPFVSYSTSPITPSQFNQPQVILNSDRIIIEAETDSVLVSAGKSVGLFSNESINLESKDINIHTDNRIRLGSKNAGESVLLGDKTYDILEFTLNVLEILSDTLAPTQIYPTGAPIPDASTQAITSTLSQAIKTVKEKVLVNIKSNKVKVE